MFTVAVVEMGGQASDVAACAAEEPTARRATIPRATSDRRGHLAILREPRTGAWTYLFHRREVATLMKPIDSAICGAPAEMQSGPKTRQGFLRWLKLLQDQFDAASRLLAEKQSLAGAISVPASADESATCYRRST